MKKGSKLLFAYFSTLIMLVGFFLPNFTYVVNAIEVDANDNLLKSGEITLTNLDDGILRLDMEDNRSKIVEVDNPNYEVENCYAVKGSMLTTEVTFDNIGCKVTAYDYGKVDVAVVLKNINNSMDNRTMHFTVDVELEKIMDYYFNKIPDTVEYSNSFYHDLWVSLGLNKSMYIDIAEDANCSVGDTCKLELIYYYWVYNGAESYSQEIKKTKVVNLVDEDPDNDNSKGTFWDKVGVGEKKEINYTPSVNIEDYFWVSLDNTVARITNNEVEGLTPGKTTIMLVHKETLDVKAQGYVEVNPVYENKSIDQVLNVFTDDIEIDISNNVGYFMEDSLDNNWAISRFAESVAANTELNVRDVVCQEGLKDCQVFFVYYPNGIETEVATQYFDVKYRGINIGWIEGTHTSEDDVSMVYADSEITLTTVINAETVTEDDPENEGQTITKEAPIIIDYDTDYLQLVDSNNYKFKTLKEGFTTITMYVGGYTTSVNVLITFSESEINDAYQILSGFDTIEVPYSSKGITDETAKELFKGIINDKIYSSDLYSYLVIDIDMLPDYNFIFSAYLEYYGYMISVGQVNEKFINGKFNDEGEEIYTGVEDIFKNVKTNYKLSFDESVKMMNSVKNYDEYIEYLLDFTKLEDVDTDKFDVAFYYLSDYYVDNYMIAGTMLSMELYYENELVGRKDFFVQLDFVLDRSVLEENTLSSKLDYVKNYLKDIGLDVNVKLEIENYYEISNDDSLFYIMLDQKELIEANGVAFKTKDMKLNIGEKHQINYILYPFGATHANVTFESSNENAFTVDKNGLITAKAKGWGFVRMSFGEENYSDIFVAVGYSDNSFFDEIVSNLDLNYEISFNEYYEYLEYADFMSLLNDYAWEDVYGYLNSLKDVFGNDSGISTFATSTGEFGMEVLSGENDDEYYLQLQIGNYISKKYKIEYRLVGIEIENTTIEVEVGKEKNANIKFTEGDISNLRYYIYNPGVISIKNGIVKGIKEGKTDVLVYDKYNRFNLIFTVYVDKDKYIAKQRELIENTTINLNSYDLNGEDLNSSYSFRKLALEKLEVLGLDYEVVLGNYDYLEQSFNEETKILTIEAYSYEFGVISSIDIQLEINAIYVESSMATYELSKDETFDVEIYKYGTLADANVTSVSKNPDICTIEGTTVTGLKSGICEINHSAGDEVIKQFFAVDTEGFVEVLNNILDTIPATMEIKADSYDYEEGLEDWNYCSLYDAYIRTELLGYLDEYKNVDLDYYECSISEENQIQISLRYNPAVKFKNNNLHYFTSAESDIKVIDLTYAGYTDEYIEQVDTIKDAIKEEYVLDIDQMLEFSLSGDSGAGIYKYSSFVKDLKKVCPDCIIYNNGSGGTDDGTGIYYAAINAIIFLHGEPITALDVNLYANINIDVLEVEDDEHVEKELKKHVKAAYKRYKDRLRNNLFVRVGNELDATDDYEVELTKLDNCMYEISIDGHTFESFVHINVLTKDFDYSIKVEEIKVNKDILNLEVGDTEKLTVTISPNDAYNKNVKWSSSNEKVVTVKDGKVTAVGSGNAVITVESLDGNAKTTIKVSVIDPKVTGDIDGDGKVNIVDLVQLRKHLAGITTLKGDALSGADVNKDGKVNILDLVKIRKHLAGLEVIK